MAKARRKHQRTERVDKDGQQAGVSEPEIDEKESRARVLLLKAHKFAEAQELDESLRCCSEVLNENPNRPEALFITAYVLLKAERFGMAYTMMSRCVALMPDREQAWNNFGLICSHLHRLDEAERCFRRALQIKPDQSEAVGNMALMFVNNCQPEEALKWVSKSLAFRPGQPDVLETRGYASLMLRRWQDGWLGYEAAVGNSKFRKKKPYKNEPYWQGEKPTRLIVRGEQGIGDEILFASCFPDVIRDCDVTVECDKRLEGLFRRSFPGVPIYGTRHDKERNWSGEFDHYCLMGTLPRHYRNADDQFPGTPFLKTDPERLLQWRVLMDLLPGKKIGIAWTGGLRNTFQARRSLTLRQLAPVLRVPGCSFISLQYRESDLRDSPVPIYRWARGAEAQDLDDVAALIDACDLVIAVTTAAAHIAGAIGKPTWVLVPEKPHWHYGVQGDRMPWYNTMRLFRQRGDWSGVINQVSEELATYIRGDRPETTSSLQRTAEQYHPPSHQAGNDLPFNLKPTANITKGSNRVHVQPLSSPFVVRL